MKNPYPILKERGFLKRETRPDEKAVEKLFSQSQTTCYVGYDGTAPSLHVGHLLTIMPLAHLRRCGHRPIALLGGATTMIGDPTGKQEMRKMLNREQILENGKAIQKQIARYLGEEGVIYENNINWFGEMNLIDFLREIGVKFTIAEMLTTESYKTRLESGLTFLEFSYQLFQAYDFLELHRKYGCRLQMGGDDQWGNICAGVDLVRKKESAQVEGMTIPLLETASGAKMGKTEKGAVWLDASMTSPYDFYQFWVNTDDRDVERFFKFYTFLPLPEIQKICASSDIRKAKETLALEVTKLTHGEEEAKKSQEAAHALFYSKGSSKEGVPTHTMKKSRLKEGISVADLFCESGLLPSKSEVRRKLKEGGLYINNDRIENVDEKVNDSRLDSDGEMLLRFGKKKYMRIVFE